SRTPGSAISAARRSTSPAPHPSSGSARRRASPTASAGPGTGRRRLRADGEDRVPLDAPLLTPHDLVRPWKRATVVASLVAAVELALLVGAGSMLVAKPLSHAIRKHAA